MKFILSSIAILWFTTILVIAQPPTIPTLPPEPEPVPITGIEYLLLGGGAYGIYRLKKGRNNKKEA
jgi:hypothetical protein